MVLVRRLVSLILPVFRSDRPSYLDKVLALTPFAYWPLNEAAGTAIADRAGSSYNGTGSANLTYNHAGPGAGNKSIYFDGNEYINITGTGFNTAFPANCGPQGSVCVWAKTDDWVTGVYTFTFLVNANNQVAIYKNNTNDRMIGRYYAGAVTKEAPETIGQTSTDWRWYCITWDKNAGADGEMKFYVNNVQVGTTQTGLGTWSGNLATAGRAIGANDNVGGSGWLGYLSEFVLFSRAISQADRNVLYAV